jgi:hypothetical protein
MFSTSKLYHELKNFRKEIEQYIDSPEYVESYILHSSDGKIFDADGLKDHLRDNPIKTDAAYNDIYLEANKIIDIYNEFENKNVKQWSNNLIKDEKLKNSFFSNVYVQAISTANGKFTYHNYIDIFTKEHEYQDFTFDRIYHICIRILNILYHFGHNTFKPKPEEKKVAERVNIGVLFLTGKAEAEYKKVGSWRKVAENLNLKTFHGQFSATSKRENKKDNENDVFNTHYDQIIDFVQKNNISISHYKYLKQE